MFNNSINVWIIAGRLGKDPEIRYTPDGSPIANFSVATSERWKDKNSGEQKERTEWVRCVVFGKRAEIIGEHFHKGDLIHVLGRSQTRKWTDKDGNEKYTTELVATQFSGDVQMLFRHGGSSSYPPPQGEHASAPAPAQQQSMEDFDDDIPF